MAATCDGGIANILGVPGGSFAFNVSPEDGAIIDLIWVSFQGVQETTVFCILQMMLALHHQWLKLLVYHQIILYLRWQRHVMGVLLIY